MITAAGANRALQPPAAGRWDAGVVSSPSSRLGLQIAHHAGVGAGNGPTDARLLALATARDQLSRPPMMLTDGVRAAPTNTASTVKATAHSSHPHHQHVALIPGVTRGLVGHHSHSQHAAIPWADVCGVSPWCEITAGEVIIGLTLMLLHFIFMMIHS
jgi:hypothetical protein